MSAIPNHQTKIAFKYSESLAVTEMSWYIPGEDAEIDQLFRFQPLAAASFTTALAPLT